MRFEGDLVLRTHMRMNGSWHIYRPGERWRKPRRDMRVVIATAAFEAGGVNLPVAEFFSGRGVDRQDDLLLIGADPLGEAVHGTGALGRLRARRAAKIG